MVFLVCLATQLTNSSIDLLSYGISVKVPGVLFLG